MIQELRIYTLLPGKMPEYTKLAEGVGTKVRGDRYGKREGGWVAEIGALNQFWHLWTYEDLNERARLRGELSQNKDWTEGYVAKIRPMLVRQEIAFLNPFLPFKPPRERGHIYEMRRYRTHVGAAKAWSEHFKAAMPTREKYSENVCAWTVEGPDPNSVCHLWAYKDLNHRAEARTAAAKDPEWQAFLGKSGPLLAEMSSTVMLPVSYSPMG